MIRIDVRWLLKPRSLVAVLVNLAGLVFLLHFLSTCKCFKYCSSDNLSQLFLAHRGSVQMLYLFHEIVREKFGGGVLSELGWRNRCSDMIGGG